LNRERGRLSQGLSDQKRLSGKVHENTTVRYALKKADTKEEFKRRELSNEMNALD
jgi:hypothetical protein